LVCTFIHEVKRKEIREVDLQGKSTNYTCVKRGYAHFAQSFYLAQKSNQKTLGFLLPWISHWFFVGFLLSPPPYAKSFLRKPSFLVLADFFPWFLKSKQLLGFLGVFYMKKQMKKYNFNKILSKLNIAKKPFKHFSEI
jgi:hypothetical protein